ncbi:MAG TPA: hypothetical protein VFY16_09330 [Gemmatimonadaceae bacterium]|nr:hypothetical protein [Gemmatimonadaceae bacterium]
MPSASSRPPSPLRRHLLRMVVLVLLVHAVAITIYYLAEVGSASRQVRTVFTGAWTLATLAVVLPLLRRIREERNKLRRG